MGYSPAFNSLMNKFVCDSNGAAVLTASSVYTASLTVSGFNAVELEITSLTGGGAIYYTLDGTSPSTTNFSGVLPATVCSVTLPCDATPTLKLWTAVSNQYIACVVRGK